MRAARARQEVMVENIIQQRDMYKSMASGPGAITTSPAALAKTGDAAKEARLMRELDEVKKEADNNPTKFAGFVLLGMSHGFHPRAKDYLVTSDCKLLDLAYVTEKFHNK